MEILYCRYTEVFGCIFLWGWCWLGNDSCSVIGTLPKTGRWRLLFNNCTFVQHSLSLSPLSLSLSLLTLSNNSSKNQEAFIHSSSSLKAAHCAVLLWHFIKTWSDACCSYYHFFLRLGTQSIQNMVNPSKSLLPLERRVGLTTGLIRQWIVILIW